MKAIQTRWLLKIGVLAVVCAALPADAIWGTNKHSDINGLLPNTLPNCVPNQETCDNLKQMSGRKIQKRTLSGSGAGAAPAAQKKELSKEEELLARLGDSPERLKEVYKNLKDRLAGGTAQVSINCLNLLGQVQELKEDIHILFQQVSKMALDEETIARALLSDREVIECLKNNSEKNDESLKATDDVVDGLKDLSESLYKKIELAERDIALLHNKVSSLPAQKPASDPVPSASPEGMGGTKEKTTETLGHDQFNKVKGSKFPKKKKSLQKIGDKKLEQELSEMLGRISTLEHNQIEKFKEDIENYRSQVEKEFESFRGVFDGHKKKISEYQHKAESVYSGINNVLGKFRENSDSFSKVLETAKQYSKDAQISAAQAKEDAEKTANNLKQFKEAQAECSELLERIRKYEKDAREYASWYHEELEKRGGNENPEPTLKECLAKKTEELQGLDDQYKTVVFQYKQAIKDYEDRIDGVNTAAATLEERQRLLEEKARKADEKLSRLDSIVAGIKTDDELQGQYNELFDQFEKKTEALRTLLEGLSMTEEDLVPLTHGNGNPSSVGGLDATLLANLRPNATSYLNDSYSIVSTDTASTFGCVGEGELVLWETRAPISLSDLSVYEQALVRLANAIDLRQDLTLAQSIVFSGRWGGFLDNISLDENNIGLDEMIRSKDFRRRVRFANNVCRKVRQFRAEKNDHGGRGKMFTPYLGESICKMLGK